MSLTDAQLVHQAADAYHRIEEIRARDRARLGSVVDEDQRINRDALSLVLPLQERDWWMPGPSSVGANVGAELIVPSESVLTMIEARCKSAPSGGPFQAEITANGVLVPNASVSITAGQLDGRSPLREPLAGGSVLRLNVLNAAGAEDVTVTAIYRPSAG